MSFLKRPLSEQLLRLALAFSFLYPPLAAVFDPYSWVGYFPTFLSDLVAPHQLVLLHAFGLVEVALALWLLFGRRIRLPAFLMALLLFVIVVSNLNQFAVVFRDLALALVALALAHMQRAAPIR
jgi:uncharacterized membrane protein YphA (DoxX/SURF4 family)